MSFEQYIPEIESPEAFTPDVEHRFVQLVMNMRKQAESETAPYSALFFGAALEHLETNEDFRAITLDFLETRHDNIPSHDLYLPLRAFQKMAMRDDPSYPKGYDVERWMDTITDNLSDEERRNEIIWDLHNRHLQTNVSERYKSIPPIIDWMRAHGRIDGGVQMLDIGCSINNGLKKLALMDIVGEEFPKTTMVEPDDYDKPWTGHTYDDELTEQVAKLQRKPVVIEYGLGLDIEDMTSPGNLEWARACLTPEELVNGSADYYDFLAIANFPNVEFMQTNLLDNYADYISARSSGEFKKYDVVTMFTVLNQLTDRKRVRMLQIARRLTKDTGLVVIQDFARVDPDVPVEIQFLNNDWNKNFSYRTIVLDNLVNRRGYQEVWRYDGGRCRTAQAGLGRIAMADGQDGISFYEYLKSV